MENINYPFVIWAGFGVIGWFILGRNQSKFLFDDLAVTTIVTVLMAFLLPIWGGPIFLLIVLLTPNKKVCVHCKRVVPEKDDICRYCQESFDVLPSELETIAKNDEKRNQEMVELSTKYGKWDIYALPLFFISVPVVGYISWLALVKISDFRYSLLPQSNYMFLPLPISWGIIAIFVGIIGSTILMYLIIRLLLGDKYSEYQKFNTMKSSGNTNKTFYIFFGAFTLLCIIASTLMLDYYTVAYPDKLVINELWNIGEKQYYTDVASILSSKQKKEGSNRLVYIVKFTNGYRLSTSWETNDRDPEQINSFMEYVSELSGIKIKNVPAFTDDELP